MKILKVARVFIYLFTHIAYSYTELDHTEDQPPCPEPGGFPVAVAVEGEGRTAVSTLLPFYLVSYAATGSFFHADAHTESRTGVQRRDFMLTCRSTSA